MQAAVAMASLMFAILIFLLRIVVFILGNSFIADFLLTTLYIWDYYFSKLHWEWYQAWLASAGVSAFGVFLIAKIKYVRIFLLMCFGAFWGYEIFYKIGRGTMEYIFNAFHTHNYFVSGIVGIVFLVAYMIYHTYYGIVWGEAIFGEPWNIFRPIEILICFLLNKINDKIAEIFPKQSRKTDLLLDNLIDEQLDFSSKNNFVIDYTNKE